MLAQVDVEAGRVVCTVLANITDKHLFTVDSMFKKLMCFEIASSVGSVVAVLASIWFDTLMHAHNMPSQIAFPLSLITTLFAGKRHDLGMNNNMLFELCWLESTVPALLTIQPPLVYLTPHPVPDPPPLSIHLLISGEFLITV